MRSGLCILLSMTLLLGVVAVCTSEAGAVEVQLAGVRLGSPIVDLLVNPSWGEPEGIGPIVGGAGRVASSDSGGAAGSGTSRGGGTGGRPGGMRGARPRGGGGGAASRRAGGAGGGAGAAQQPKAGTSIGVQYWLYRRPSGVEVILAVERSGAIAMIDVQGPADFTIYTSRGIGLGDTYSDLVNAYGYPDHIQTVGEGLVISYPEQNVTFTLGNLRVSRIRIGDRPAPSAQGATARQRASSPAGRTGTTRAARQRGGRSPRGFGGARGRTGARPRRR